MSSQRVDSRGAGPGAAIDAADVPRSPDESLFRRHFENLPKPAYIWQKVGDDFLLIAHNEAAAAAGGPCSGAAGSARQLSEQLVMRLTECAETQTVLREEIDYPPAPPEPRRLIVTMIPVARDVVVQHSEDITDRHRAEQELRASEARIRALMEANPDMLVRVSRDGDYLDVHIPPGVSKNLPFGPEHFHGHNVAELFEPEFAEAHARYRRKALETGEVQLWQYARMAGGRTRYIDARFHRSGDDEVVVAVTDVTERVDLEREVVNSVERERNMIGHDLHDGLGQLLTGVKLMLEPLKRNLSAADPRDANALSQAVDLLNQAIAQTSELARGLSPVPRDGGCTLANALQQLARRTEEFFNISCCVARSDVADGLNEECSNNLYRIAQEAITNAAKHGKATRVELRCYVRNGRQVLEIEDNGEGMSEPKANARGMGMHIMQYRARAIGGQAVVRCRDGGGVIVSCSCPVPLPGQ
ncbi:MAG: PAS domain-containing protein [Gammaproteobacteria bacterium]|nr:PAS domain-containing protein [Gammaproteobacteria bacterium]